MEAAVDPLALAKARELLKAAQWDLERVCRRIYGEDKANIHLNVIPSLTIVTSEQHKTIEHDSEQLSTRE